MAANKNFKPEPGSQFHVLRAITIANGVGLHAQAEVVERGRTLTVTAGMYESTQDKFGRSWMDDIADEAAQVQRWGEVRVAPGPWPTDEPTWTTHGDAEWEQQHERARALAFSVADEAERAAALRAVRATYGNKATNIEVARYAGDA